MTSDSTPAKPGGMLSLYANLLDPSAANSPGTISRAPVVFKQAEGEAQSEEAAAKKQVNNGEFCLFMLSMLAQITLTVHRFAYSSSVSANETPSTGDPEAQAEANPTENGCCSSRGSPRQVHSCGLGCNRGRRCERLLRGP